VSNSPKNTVINQVRGGHEPQNDAPEGTLVRPEWGAWQKKYQLETGTSQRGQGGAGGGGKREGHSPLSLGVQKRETMGGEVEAVGGKFFFSSGLKTGKKKGKKKKKTPCFLRGREVWGVKSFSGEIPPGN